MTNHNNSHSHIIISYNISINNTHKINNNTHNHKQTISIYYHFITSNKSNIKSHSNIIKTLSINTLYKSIIYLLNTHNNNKISLY